VFRTLGIMAEFASGIVGLATAAEVVFSRINKFIRHVKNAERDILQLSAEVSGLHGTLRSISLLVAEFEGVGGDAITNPSQLTVCDLVLDRLRDRLAPFHDNDLGSPDNIRRKWKWPFTRSETVEFVQHLKLAKSTLNLALSADSISKTLDVLSETRSNNKDLQEIKALLEARYRISLDEKKEELLSTVGPCNPLQHHQANVALRREGTLIWFIDNEDFQTWIHTKNSKIWVYGIPGAGKTVLAAAAITKTLQLSNEHNAVAYFYCDYKDDETQQPLRILGSLAEQIARQSERSFSRLDAFVKQKYPSDRMNTFNCSCEELCQLIIEMASDFQNVTISVDGIDECGDNIRTVMSYIVSLGNYSTQVRTLLSSRDLVEIRDFLEGYETISIAAQSVDLRLYVGAEIEQRLQKTSRKRLFISDPNLKGEIMDKLIDGAEGMFRWVAVQLDYTCDQGPDADIRSALRSLPPDLFSSYKRLLEYINKKPRSSRLLVQQALKWIMWQGRINARALGEALSVKPGQERLDFTTFVHEERILQLCGSLVRKSIDEDCIESAHFTVKEFLLSLSEDSDSSLTFYSLNETVDERRFAITALNYLCCEDFENVETVQIIADADDKEYPFQRIASRFALGWAHDHLDIAEVFEPLTRLFSPSHAGNRQLLLLNQSRTSRLVDGIKENIWSDILFIPSLHHAALAKLPRLCEWLLQNQNEPTESSPFGPPLACALCSFGLGFKRDYDYESMNTIIQLLLKWGANPAGQSKINYHQDKRCMLCLTLSSFGEDCPFSVIQTLVEGGALYCNKCFDTIEELYKRYPERAPGQLIKSIKPEQVEPASQPRLAQLMAVTLQLAESNSDTLVRTLTSICNVSRATGEFIWKAIKFGNASFLANMIESKLLDVNWINENGENAVHLAVKENQLAITKCLLEYGFSLNVKSIGGVTPLHLATVSASEDLILFLLSRGAGVHALDQQMSTVWHYAVEENNWDALRVLQDVPQRIEALPMLNQKNIFGESALILASRGFLTTDSANLLLKAGPDATIKDNNGWAAIHHATSENNLKIVQLLSHDCACWKDRCTFFVNNSPEYSDMLITHIAALKGNVQCLKFLLGFSAYFDIDDKSLGCSLLNFATISGNHDTVEYLLQSGASSTTASDGWTPLHFAVNLNHLHIASLLLQHGHDPHAADCNSVTPMMMARHNQYMAFILAVEEKDARQAKTASDDPNEERLTLRNLRIKQSELSFAIRTGNTPRCLTVQHACIVLVEAIRRYIIVPDTISSQFFMSSSINVQVFYLSQHSAAVDYMASYAGKGREWFFWPTPLHFAVGENDIKSVTILLDHGASVDYTGGNLIETALALSLRRGYQEMVALLLDRGACIQCRDSLGVSCSNLIVRYHYDWLPENVVSQAFDNLEPGLNEETPITDLIQSEDVTKWSQRAIETSEMTTFDHDGHVAIYSIWNRMKHPSEQACVLNLGIDLGRTNTTFGSALHYDWLDSQASLLRRLLKRLGSTTSQSLLNIKPEYCNTPLYDAAARGRLKIISLMLKCVASIDLKGGREGSALMVAAAYGRENTVKQLVRAEAATSYFDEESGAIVSVYKKAKPFPKIRQWLLVGRWTEMRFITWI
ncbi:MAG: hypothetical protein Q9214_002852, partial [Letrouitia sp. 1 TL-2023]